jgi:hypothetical protein
MLRGGARASGGEYRGAGGRADRRAGGERERALLSPRAERRADARGYAPFAPLRVTRRHLPRLFLIPLRIYMFPRI